MRLNPWQVLINSIHTKNTLYDRNSALQIPNPTQWTPFATPFIDVANKIIVRSLKFIQIILYGF
jgi:hypothetical protein